MSMWTWTVKTGNDELDRRTIEGHRQQAAAQGMRLDVAPMPGGGYQLQAVAGAPHGAPQGAAWGPSWGQAQTVGAAGGVGGGGGGAGAVGAAGATTALTPERVRYLRKVYGLLTMAVFVAVFVGYASIALSPTTRMKAPAGQVIDVPLVVAILLQSRAAMWGAWGLLMAATFVASWVSKVRVLNVIALLGVSALMGVELAPMAFVAQFYAGLGATMSAAPVRDAFAMVAAVFVGITGYVFVTRKDFSYLAATLSMGFFVVFGASILAIFLHSEVFSLAVASAGALLAAGLLLFQTSYIFRNSAMDDPVDDALALLVQIRNLFMFLLRIFMSSRD